MPKRIKLRTLTSEEEQEVRRLAKSRKESVRLVQRAKLIRPCWMIQSLPLLVQVSKWDFEERRWALNG
jgi:hypothetical protein